MMLKEITGYCNSIKESQAKVKAALSEIKKHHREPTVEWMKLRIRSMTWNIRNEKAFN